jgi:hypothetical protein
MVRLFRSLIGGKHFVNCNRCLGHVTGGTIFPAKTEERVYEALEETDVDCTILVVGTSRPFPALLIEGVPPVAQSQVIHAFEKHDDHINQAFPAYSRLHSDMVYFLKDDEKFVRTVKGTPTVWVPGTRV